MPSSPGGSSGHRKDCSRNHHQAPNMTRLGETTAEWGESNIRASQHCTGLAADSGLKQATQVPSACCQDHPEAQNTTAPWRAFNTRQVPPLAPKGSVPLQRRSDYVLKAAEQPTGLVGCHNVIPVFAELFV